MLRLTAEHITQIHSVLESEFPTMTRGFEKPGMVESVIDKINREFVDTGKEDIFLEAATMMEAITRWHIFTDGNKRTGLTTAYTLLYINDFYLAIPIDAVKFTVDVASTLDNDPESTEKLIKEISLWLRKYTSTDVGEFAGKIWKYSLWPTIKLSMMDALHFKKYAERKKREYFMIKGHEDYEKKYAKEALQTARFFILIIVRSLQQLNKKEHNVLTS